jgi:hypothetical protein
LRVFPRTKSGRQSEGDQDTPERSIAALDMEALQRGDKKKFDEGGGYDAAKSNQPWENYQDYGHNHWRNSLIRGRAVA